MRLTCPYCGERDRREFYYQGAVVALDRPEKDAGLQVWDDYLHNRENPAGETQDLWQHVPCATWIKVTRDTVSHQIKTSETVTP